jgi:hypothetical protein
MKVTARKKELSGFEVKILKDQEVERTKFRDASVV